MNKKTFRLKHRSKFKSMRIPPLVLCLLVIGVAYALLQTTLNIKGTMGFVSSSWNIYFDNIVIDSNSVEAVVVPSINASDKTKLNFSVQLSKPTDYYEFEVDMVNAGTIDAIITDIRLTGVPDELREYVLYNVKYTDGSSIFVGDYLKASTTKGIKVRIEFNKNANISSLLDNYETDGSLTDAILPFDLETEITFEQKSKENVSEEKSKVDVKILGNKMTAYMDNTASKYVSNENGIDFSRPSSDVNGKGLYVKNDTINDNYPIYYYRGNVDNNNVVFADACWKIVRTTETGGTKLLYSGSAYPEIDLTETDYTGIVTTSAYPYSFDETTKMWSSSNHANDSIASILFRVSEDGDYVFYFDASTEKNYDIGFLLINGEQVVSFSGSWATYYQLGNLKKTDNIFVVYVKDSSSSSGDDTIKFKLSKIDKTATPNCTDNSSIGQYDYNPSSNNPKYVGYMYNSSTYSMTNIAPSNLSIANVVYANDVMWDGSKYTLKGELFNTTGDWTKDYTSVSNGHHYTCLSVNGTTCTTLYYAIHVSSSEARVVAMKSGSTLDTVFNDIFPNRSTRNKTDSDMKVRLDFWYKKIIEGKTFENNIEDTIWCNDREISDYGSWDKNSSLLSNYLVFSPVYRLRNYLYPVLSCANVQDSFTLKKSSKLHNLSLEGNSTLDYPVGLITTDEAVLAGAMYITNNTSYLNSGYDYWTISPYQIDTIAGMAYVSSTGALRGYASSGLLDVRPSISLNASTIVSSGDGTATNPYIIK